MQPHRKHEKKRSPWSTHLLTGTLGYRIRRCELAYYADLLGLAVINPAAFLLNMVIILFLFLSIVKSALICSACDRAL